MEIKINKKFKAGQIDPKSIQSGEIISENQKYVNRNRGSFIMENGKTIGLGDGYIERAEMYSASQYNSERKTTKTEIAQIITANPNKAMTIMFTKVLKPSDKIKEINTELFEAYPNKGGKILSEEDYQKKVKAATKKIDLKGEEDVIQGWHYNTFDSNGYLKVIKATEERDPSKEYDTRERRVSLSNVIGVIVNNEKVTKK